MQCKVILTTLLQTQLFDLNSATSHFNSRSQQLADGPFMQSLFRKQFLKSFTIRHLYNQLVSRNRNIRATIIYFGNRLHCQKALGNILANITRNRGPSSFIYASKLHLPYVPLIYTAPPTRPSPKPLNSLNTILKVRSAQAQ